MGKFLMLWPDVNQPIPARIRKEYNNDNLELANLYKKANLVQRAIRKILSKIGCCTLRFCDSWIRQLNNYDTILIHVNIINYTVPHYLRKRGFKGRIILWYWNPVCASVHPSKINQSECELWSFSRSDCNTYGLRYNSTYSFFKNDDINPIPSAQIFFIGLDKGRAESIIKLESYLKSKDISTEFIIVADSTSNKNKIKYSEPISYDKVLSKSKGAEVLLEILQDKQYGESLRTMEAIQLNKKLITNNKLIRLEPYYNPTQFFIIEHNDNYEGLIDFINTPIEPKQNLENINYYDFNNWIERFK